MKSSIGRTAAAAWLVAAATLVAGCSFGIGGEGQRVVSDNGLGVLVGADGRVLYLQLDDHSLKAGGRASPGGFYTRPPGPPTGRRVPLRGNSERQPDGSTTMDLAAGGVALAGSIKSAGRYIIVEADVRNAYSGDTAAVVGFSLPLDAEGWTIGRSLYEQQTIDNSGTWGNLTSADENWDGRQVNRGLFTPIYNREGLGIAIGVEPDRAQVFRAVYRDDLGLAIEFDLALCDASRRFKQHAPVRLIIYRFDPSWGYRSALADYLAMFSDFYRTRPLPAKGRVGRIDLCSAAVDIPSTGAGRPTADDEAIRRDVALWWAGVGEGGGTAGVGAAHQNSYITGRDGLMRTWTVAPASATGARRNAWVHQTPLNPDPELSVPNQASLVARVREQSDLLLLGGLNDFCGRYLDNYRPEHLAVMDCPPTFSDKTLAPVQPGLTRAVELLRPLSDSLRRSDVPLLADVEPWRAGPLFEAAWLDAAVITGSTPRNLDNLAFLRSLMGPKPILMTGPIESIAQDQLTVEQLQRDAHHLLALGIVPELALKDQAGQLLNPQMNELADLGRWMAAAGWQAIPHAITSHPGVTVERFGGNDADDIYMAVHNRTDAPLVYRLTVNLAPLGLTGGTLGLVDAIGNQPISGMLTAGRTLDVSGRLGPGRTDVLLLQRVGRPAMTAIASLPAPSPASDGMASADRTPRYDGQSVGAMQRQLALGEQSWKQFLACYEAEKAFVARNAAGLFAVEAARNPAAGSGAAADAAVRGLVDHSVRVYRGQYKSVLNGPQFVTFGRMRQYDAADAAGMTGPVSPALGAAGSGRAGRPMWHFDFRHKIVSTPEGPRLKLVCWDPTLETGKDVRGDWERD